MLDNVIDHAHEGYRCPGATLVLRGGYSVGLILRRSEGVRVGHVPGSARSVLAN